METKQYTMARKDWGSMINGIGSNRSNEALLDKIGRLRWEGKTHDDDNEKLTINLTPKEVSVLFHGKDGFSKSRYLNTRRMYQQVARIYKAFGFQPPIEHLPHDVLKVRKPKPGAVGLDSIPEILNGTFVPHTAEGAKAFTRASI